MADSKEADLEELGFSRVDGDWKGYLRVPSTSNFIENDWPDVLNSMKQSETRRGQLNTIHESGGTSYFVKQYHHGGVFATEGDVYFESPERFINEALATARAEQGGIPVPVPRGVLYRETDDGWVGFYLSDYCPSRSLSRVLRKEEQSALLEKAGHLLGKLHDLKLDHRDYHVDNLRVDEDGELVVTDFDPISFTMPGPWTRSLRVRRFCRSLEKYGFSGSDLRTFERGYTQQFDLGTTIPTLQSALLGVKNSLSDLRYGLESNRSFDPIDLDRVLVRAPNWLGDTVMSLPMLQILDDADDTGPVDVAVRAPLAGVYRASPAVNRVHTIEDGKQWHLPASVEKEYYSLAIAIPKSLRVGLQLFRSGIPRRLGFNTQGRGLFLTDRVPLDGADREIHHAKLYLRLVERCVSVPSTMPGPRLNVSDRVEGDPVEEFELPDDYVTIHPGTAYGPAKRWPPDQFNQLLQDVTGNDLTVVALGVESEREIAGEVLAGLDDNRVVNLVGETSLTECMAVLTESRATVANDSGIMHLSAALGTPTVGIFGSSTPELTSPLGDQTRVVYQDVDCSPCFERECPLDEDRYHCLTRIEPSAVLGALDDLMDVQFNNGSKTGSNC